MTDTSHRHPLAGARHDALIAGLTRYHGKACNKCGRTERYTSSMDCVACARVRKRRNLAIAKLPAIERVKLRRGAQPSNAGQARDYTPPRRNLHPFVEMLRARRYERGMSQAVLAEQIGYSHATLQDWESGRRQPQMSSLCNWAESLGMKLELVG